jgi:hypothetical protein
LPSCGSQKTRIVIQTIIAGLPSIASGSNPDQVKGN